MFDDPTGLIGIAAGVCTSASLLPQLIKLLRNKSAEDLSLIFLSVLLLGLALWIWYGIRRNDVPIIATNGFSLFINSLMIFFRIKYSGNR